MKEMCADFGRCPLLYILPFLDSNGKSTFELPRRKFFFFPHYSLPAHLFFNFFFPRMGSCFMAIHMAIFSHDLEIDKK